MAEKKNIVIVGGGIIGSTCAYFLSHHPKFNPATTTITLLEASKIAGGASGKAGGLLALWAYPSCIVPLSYRLHKELADKHNGADRWGYRAVSCGQLEANGRAPRRETKGSGKGIGIASQAALSEGDNATATSEAVSLQKRTGEALKLLRAAGVPDDLDWVVADGVRAYEEMGGPDSTAQVHPYQFTTSMAKLAEEAGVRVVTGAKVTEIGRSREKVESVRYQENGEEKTIPADTVVIAAGPWTPTVYPPAPISSLRAHSVTIRPTRPVSAYALFTEISLPRGGKSSRMHSVTPEIYARPNNEVYACGEGDHMVRLPPSTDLVEVDESRCQDIVDYVGSISDELRDGEVTARQACYLPSVTRGGGPMVGESGTKGLLIATGHTCWGIQNAPGTGKLISEIVWDGKAKSADIASLDPRKYM